MEMLVQAQYDRLATIYDRRWQFYITNTLSFLVVWAGIAPQDQVLDVACGTGEFERLLTAKHPQQAITGVDFSASMLAIAREKCAAFSQVRFRQASATALPWPQPQFDIVVCANAFHYFDQPTSVLAEMGRVLHPGGKIVILDWCRDFWACRLCDWVLGWFDPAYQQCYSEAELHDLIQAAGYSIQRAQRIRFGVIWGMMAVEAIAN
ncbi:MAG: methyltransferase domain-containing protein [Leptolyngbya sp. SIO1D8]|nr:methyltransferase domain-containing protein [Leptolyngbya sp. SIO1D8]